MAQHFLLSAAARTLSLKAIYQAGEEAAYETFRKIRWTETAGEPVCPRCGSLDHYDIPTRRKFKCAAKECRHQFSVTSGHDLRLAQDDLHRSARRDLHLRERGEGHFGLPALPRSGLPVQDRLRARCTNSAKRSTRRSPARRWTTKLKSTARTTAATSARRTCKEDRIDRRLSEHQTGTRRVVVALRERGGRTLPFVTMHEARRRRDRQAHRLPHGEGLCRRSEPLGCVARRLDGRSHQPLEAYSQDGANTNQVESYFSRLRRMVDGQHHRVSAKYLYQYANEAAWKEDHRRLSNGALRSRTLGLALHHPVSRKWAGYWQRAI